MPLAAFATWADGGTQLQLRAAWGDVEGHLPLVQVHVAGVVASLAEAEALGQQAADLLRAQGAQPAASAT